ncbi:hypothetical protein ACFLZW_07575 [Chloroflexota bacterium]
MLCTSWLGLGERNGLAATEQILFALGYSPKTIYDRLGISLPLWYSDLDLKQLTAIAHTVRDMLNIPIKSTDPIISTNMNDIATGAYYNNPSAFKPFDPQKELNVPPRFILSHLANHSIVNAIAKILGYTLDKEQTKQALRWVKFYAFSSNQSVIPESAFVDFLAELTATQ